MYCFNSRIRYSEVNQNKQLDLASIINYFQDCSTFHSEDVGVGIDYLEDSHRVWILSSWQIIVNRYPTLFETITTGTWAYDFNKVYAYRNFIMKSEQGETLAYANSIWILMDTSTGRPTKITEQDCEKYGLEPKYEMDYAPRKIALPSSWESFDAIQVLPSHIDTNNHVNNGQYIKIAENYLPTDFRIRQMRAEYRQSAVLGDNIIPKRSITNDLCTVMLSSEADKPYAVIEFQKA